MRRPSDLRRRDGGAQEQTGVLRACPVAHPRATPQQGEPTPIRELVAEITAELEARLERRPGVAYLIRLALRMRRAGAEGFAGVEPILLVAELTELLPTDFDGVLDRLHEVAP